MNKILSTTAALFLATSLASAWQYPGGVGAPPSTGPTIGLGRGTSEPKREKPPEFRTLTGKVLDKDDSPVKDAIVYLKNRKTQSVRTFVADADGAFRFPNLSRTEDYEIYAEAKGQKSLTKVLSSFDNRVSARLNLQVEPIEVKKEGKQEQVAKKDEKKEEKKDEPRIDDRVQPPQSPQ